MAPEHKGTSSAVGPTFRILGPLEAQASGGPIALGPFKQRVALALMLCNANRIAPVGLLVEALWGDRPPCTAHKNLQVYISNLRRLLFAGRQTSPLAYHAPGYQITLSPAELDMLRFEDLARAGRLCIRGGNLAGAAGTLRQALALWRTAALADLRAVPLIDAEATRLESRRLSVYEDWIEAEISLGHYLSVFDVIEDLIERHPLRERLRSAQLLVLSRSGRQSEALAEYDNLRQLLARELGLQPSPALTRLYQRILAGGPLPGTLPPDRTPVRLGAEVVAHYAQLPRDVEDFTGRRDIVDALLAGLSEDAQATRLMILTGGAGTGKTALAVRVAHLLLRQFPDGVLFMGLRTADRRPRSPSEVLAEFLDRFGLEVPLHGGSDARAAMYRAWLAERRLLLVLDDAVDEGQVRPLLPGSGSSKVLVTSRCHLGGLEAARHAGVGPMTPSDAVELLSQIAGHDRVEQDLAAARRIAASCGFLPLAIRICGVKLDTQPHLPLHRLADRLGDERRMLDELVVGDLAIRACGSSHEQDLAPADLAASLKLGMLSADRFTLAELADLLGAPLETAESVVERLIDSRLVDPAPGVSGDEDEYVIPSWLRLYLRERQLQPDSSAAPR